MSVFLIVYGSDLMSVYVSIMPGLIAMSIMPFKRIAWDCRVCLRCLVVCWRSLSEALRPCDAIVVMESDEHFQQPPKPDRLPLPCIHPHH